MNIARFIYILAVESYATLRYVLPLAILWVWRKYVCGEVKTVEISPGFDAAGLPNFEPRSVYLNIHGKLNNSKAASAVLFCHGDYGHPYTLLHLAEIAQKEGLAVFSLYIPKVHDDQQLELDDEIFQNTFAFIENLLRNEKGDFSGILGVGHSKGAILLAKQHFVNLDPRIKSLFSIAGGLNILKSKRCSSRLRELIKEIYEGVMNHPERPLTQIVPKEDWKAPREAMAVRPHESCYDVPGMHLSALYTKETRKHFADFIR